MQSSAASRNDPHRPFRPAAHERRIRLSIRDRLASFLFMGLVVAVAGAIIWALIQFVGLDAMAQLYGADHVVPPGTPPGTP